MSREQDKVQLHGFERWGKLTGVLIDVTYPYMYNFCDIPHLFT